MEVLQVIKSTLQMVIICFNHVCVCVCGSCLGDVDFSLVEIPIAIMSPNTSLCSEIFIEDDNLHEGNETFSVYISSPDDDAVILTSSSLAIMIQDDDGKDILM